jgi:hypothetical protein
MRTHVSFHTHANGSVSIVATGKNGTLTLKVHGDTNGPTLAVLDQQLRPQGAWGLRAHGKLEGWIVDAAGKIKWFPEHAKPQPRKQSAKRRQAPKSVRKGG